MPCSESLKTVRMVNSFYFTQEHIGHIVWKSKSGSTVKNKIRPLLIFQCWGCQLPRDKCSASSCQWTETTTYWNWQVFLVNDLGRVWNSFLGHEQGHSRSCHITDLSVGRPQLGVLGILDATFL